MKKEYKYFTKAIPLPNGKRKYIRGKTERELNRKVLEFMASLGREEIDVSSDMTVEELAELWLAQVKKPSVKPQSYRVYEDRVRCHLIPAIGSMKISDVKLIHIIHAVNNYGYGAKQSNDRLLSVIRAIFSFAVDNDLLAKSPANGRVNLTGTRVRDEKPLTPNQTKMLLEHCRKQPDQNIYLFTLLALVTGMRRGEIAALRWDCVDFDEGQILVRRQMVDATGEVTDDLKTASAKRDIPIPQDTVALLRRVRAQSNSTYVIGGPHDGHIDSKDVQRYDRIWNNAGVTPQKIHAHLFRKTFATRLIETGTDPKRVQYLLGHTTLEMTLGIYAKYDQESQQAATKKLIDSTFGSYAGCCNVAN